MANTRDTTAHIIAEEVRRQVRTALRDTRLKSTTGTTTVVASTASGGVTSGGGVGDGGTTGGAAASTGTDYSVWPLGTTAFSSFEERLGNLEEFVAYQYVTTMRGTVADGGHQHSGTDGDAPKLPATAVLLPVGSVSGGTSLADHLQDTSVHSGVSRAICYDDFQTTDQDGRFQVLAGAPVRVDAGGGQYQWKLPAGTILRLKGDGGFSFNQRVTVRFDLKFEGADVDRRFEVRYRVRPTATGYTYIAGFSASSPCYLAELDNTLAFLDEVATGGQIANDGLVRTYEAQIGNAALASDLGPILNQTLGYTIPRGDGYGEGYLELYAIGTVYLDNIVIARHYNGMVQSHHTTHYEGAPDELDVADLADRDGLLAPGGTPGLHAATHAAAGSDPLDVADLADATGTRLTPGERFGLTGAGNADLYHTHAGLLDLEGTIKPTPNRRTAAVGTSVKAAAADHNHVQPYWKLEWYLVSDFSAGYLPTDADFDTSPRGTVRKSFLPSVGGEFQYAGYGTNLYLRATLKIKNSGSDRSVALLVPSLNGTLRVDLKNSVGTVTLASQTTSSPRLNTSFTADLKGGETNTLVLYCGANVANWAFWVACAEANGDMLDPTKNLSFVEP